MSKASELSIGTRLAEIRQSRGFSQRKVAELAGLTHSAVSTVEQNKVSPSVSTLHKLLAVYDLSLADFFAEEERGRHRTNIVIEPEERVELGSKGVSLAMLKSARKGAELAMMIENYEPGSSTGEQMTHEGEEVGTILEGEIEITYNGEVYVLGPGQSYAIDTNIPHTFANTSNSPCKLISAITPLTL